MGLVLTHKLGEAIHIGNDIKITLTEVQGKQTKIHIEAPQSVNILRDAVKKRNEANGQHRKF